MAARKKTQETEEEEENLYGCYLLYCTNPLYKGNIYIGYTVNPNRRIKQHNRGIKFGGAKRTNNHGPWEMALIIHGFPNSVSALRFEWAWQNPQKSTRTRHIAAKTRKETRFEYRFRVVSEMLRVGPWHRLPLVIRWLKQEYVIEFNPLLRPPSHMPIVYGPVVTRKVSESSQSDDSSLTDASRTRCCVCQRFIQDSDTKLSCVNRRCTMESHLVCLAKSFVGNDDHILPVEGTCPVCEVSLLWGDLIRLKQGCYRNLREKESSDEDE